MNGFVQSDDFGAFSPANSPVVGPVVFSSESGSIHLSSSENFQTLGPSTLTIGSNTDELTLTSVSGDITVDPFFNIFITNGVTTGGNVLMIAQNDIEMTDTGSIIAGGEVQLVCDNQAPFAPLIGPGAFRMDPLATIVSGDATRVFTSRQSLNTILGTINGVSYSQGPIYEDSDTETWCTYYPLNTLGFPFTIFYKDCLASLTSQANDIVVEGIVSFHPYNEYPGWFEQFTIGFEDGVLQKYMLRRRHLQRINQPKSWTVWMH